MLQGRYEEACDFFNKAYTLARARNDNALISSSRVQFGIAQAHKMNAAVANQIDMGNTSHSHIAFFYGLLLFGLFASFRIL